MSENTPHPDFSDVAAETPEESVEREHEVTDLIEAEADERAGVAEPEDPAEGGSEPS